MTPWSDQPVRLLFTWARWLSMHHPTLTLVNVVVPGGSALIWLLIIRLVPGFNVTRDMGLVVQASSLLLALAPFFVAALALVAGFPGEALDRPMGGVQPYIVVAGERYCPSRREVLGYLFAYLAGLSLLAYLAGAFVLAASHPAPANFLVWTAHIARGWPASVLKSLYGAVLIHLLSVTLLGLHFLGNFMTSSRLNRISPPAPLPPNTTLAASASGRGNQRFSTAGKAHPQSRRRLKGG